ncbi:MAG: hypothetical protein Q7J06_00270 [Bacteroidales bacterium]|nr:hypothetical protein [Bacteroidales bacterium]
MKNKKYNITIEMTFPVLAENEIEAEDIAGKMIRDLRRGYSSDFSISKVEEVQE